MKSLTPAALAVLALLAGCAKDQIVDVHLPISRMELPDAGERMFEGGAGPIGAIRLRLTEKQTEQEPDTVRPEMTEGAGALLKVQAAPTPMLAGGLKLYSEGVGGGQVKLMPLAPLLRDTPLALAFTFHYAETHDDYDYEPDWFEDTPETHTDVKQRLVDYAAIVGVRVARGWQVFGGPYRSVNHYGGHYRQDRRDMFGNPAPYYRDFGDKAVARGGNLGVAWDFSRWGRVLAEVAGAHVRAHDSADMAWMPTVAYQMNFGPRFRRDPPAPDQRVRVVPLEPAHRPD